jgi:LuxR family maltose regulon positive regulatory protein
MTEKLTAREAEVVRLLALGCTYVQISDRLGVSAHTVGSHIKNLYRKLDAHSGRMAVMRAVQLQLLEPNFYLREGLTQ